MVGRARTTELLAVVVAAAMFLTGCSVFGGGDERSAPWFEELIPGGPATLADVCSAVCTADLVVLPELQPVESVVDIPMPETAGALSVERVWTGQRGGLFGVGWESVWDLRISDSTLTGPVPATPLAKPERDSSLTFSDDTTIDFDDDGRPTRICPDASRCTLAEWTENSLRLSVADAFVEFELSDGRVRAAVSGDGRRATYTYDGEYLVSVRSDAGRVGYRYEDGQLAGVDGSSPRMFEYVNGSLRGMTDRYGRRWTFGLRGGNEITVTDPDGVAVSYSFVGRALATVTGPDGTLLRRVHDDDGLQREERPEDGVTLVRVGTRTFEAVQERPLQPVQRAVYTLDEVGRVVRSESAEGEVAITYDGNSARPVFVRRGGPTTELVYDTDGLLVESIDPDGYRVSIDRDALGQVRVVTDGVLTTEFEYDAAGRAISETSAGRTTTAEYEADGRVRSLVLPDGSALPVRYDATGSLRSIGSDSTDESVAEAEALVGSLDDDAGAAPVGVTSDGGHYRLRSGTSVQYDDWGRLIETGTDGRITRRHYDALGQLTVLTLADGREYSVEYTPAGRIRSVSDGEVTAELEWHGDLLMAVSTSLGSTYRYEYDESGRLLASEVGLARWTYQYDDAGNLSRVDGPSGMQRYEWDHAGRPTESFVNGRVLHYDWSGSGLDLETVTEANAEQPVVRLERDRDGRVTAIESPDGEATFEYSAGQLVGYRFGDGPKVTVTYDSEGNVASLEHDGTTEQWQWDDGELSAVTVDDARYDLEWLAPGVLESASVAGEVVLRVVADPLGRPTSIHDGDDLVGTFEWSPAGVTGMVVDESSLTVDYDAEFRPVRIESSDSLVTVTYEGGVPTQVVANDATITTDYRDGAIASSRFQRGDDWTAVDWTSEGQPAEFASSEGQGVFEYRDGRVVTIGYDDHRREVRYDEQGRPSAEATGGDFLDDLFGSGGVFTTPGGELISAPQFPWFDRLPSELGVELPGVVTGSDVAAAALSAASPPVPLPLAPDDGLAERTRQAVAALAVPSALPTAADRNGPVVVDGVKLDIDGLLAAAPTAVVAQSVLNNLSDGPCLLCRVADAGGWLVGQLGRAGGALVGLLTDNPIGRAVMSVAFFAASFVLGTVCVGLCGLAVGIAAPLAFVLVSQGPTGVADALVGALLEPLVAMANGVLDLDPAALVTVGLTIAAFRAGRSMSPRLAALRSKAVTPLCHSRRVVCVSVSRYGQAAEHIVDAQRNGAPRLLRLDRAGAEARRLSALRSVPSLAGFDRDEYPFAISSVRSGLSIRYVDTASNRSLGAYLGRQLSALPDGARFYVLPIGS